MKKVYQSFDGKYFDTEFECADYERRNTDSKDIEVFDEYGDRIALDNNDDFNTFSRKIHSISYVRIKNEQELQALNRLVVDERANLRPFPPCECRESDFYKIGDYFKNHDYDDMDGYFTKEDFEERIADDTDLYYNRDDYNAAKHFFGWKD